MFSLATSIPAPISAVICSWLEVAGPRVQTIFARRLILNPLPVVYTTVAHARRPVTRLTERSPAIRATYAPIVGAGTREARVRDGRGLLRPPAADPGRPGAAAGPG